ncbi:TPA: nucleoid-associated protein, partial [Klebsiella quasipneumoniae subsp. quasipneumoniae]|nr:nucleoid-associated protein [Klebsiella quasipneumoniae subsp. quasipneumoniae]
STVPADKYEHMDNFITYLNSEEIGLPLEFSINRAVLGRRAKVKAKSNGWELNFERRFFGTAPGSVIQYNRADKKLIISKLDENIIQKLEAVLKERG